MMCWGVLFFFFFFFISWPVLPYHCCFQNDGSWEHLTFYFDCTARFVRQALVVVAEVQAYPCVLTHSKQDGGWAPHSDFVNAVRRSNYECCCLQSIFVRSSLSYHAELKEHALPWRYCWFRGKASCAVFKFSRLFFKTRCEFSSVGMCWHFEVAAL